MSDQPKEEDIGESQVRGGVGGGMEEEKKAMDAQYILIVFYNYSYINHKVSIKLWLKPAEKHLSSFFFFCIVLYVFLLHFNITRFFFLYHFFLIITWSSSPSIQHISLPGCLKWKIKTMTIHSHKWFCKKRTIAFNIIILFERVTLSSTQNHLNSVWPCINTHLPRPECEYKDL